MRKIERFKDLKILRLIFLFSIFQSSISQSSSAPSITLGNLAKDQFFSFCLNASDAHYGWLNSNYLWPPISGSASPDTHDILNQNIHQGFGTDTTKFLRYDAQWKTVTATLTIHNNDYHSTKYADSIRVKQFEDSIRVFTDSTRSHNNAWHSTKYADSTSNKVFHDSTRSHTNVWHTPKYADSISVKAHRDSMVGIHGSTASPAAGKIPIANGFAKLDSWVTLGLASLIAQKSIINSNAETQVLISEPIPANFLIAGTSFLIKAKGLLNTYSTPPSLTIRARVGPVTLVGNIATSVVLIPSASLTTKPFWIEFLIIVRTVGANGTMIGNGEGAGSIGTTGAFYYLGTTTVATAAINTIAVEGNYVELTAQFNTANAQNIVTFNNAVIMLVKR